MHSFSFEFTFFLWNRKSYLKSTTHVAISGIWDVQYSRSLVILLWIRTFFSTSKFDKIISSSHHLWFFSVFFFLRQFVLFWICYSYKIFGNYNHYTVDFMSGAIKKLNLFAFYMKGKWTFITICEVHRIDNNHPYVQFRTRNLFSLSVTFELFEPKDVFVWLEPLNFFRERSYRHL